MSTEHFAEIIREAATSPLGILALIILLLGSLAVIFFGKSSEKARMTVWVMAFGGALVFGFAILRAEQGTRDGRENPPGSESLGGRAGEQEQGTPELAGEELPMERNQESRAPSRATIQIAYTGDDGGCRLPLTVSVGDRSFQPQGHLARLDDVPLGIQPYRIAGSIFCSYTGVACSVDSEGLIEVAAGHTYYLGWQYFPARGCDAELQGVM